MCVCVCLCACVRACACMYEERYSEAAFADINWTLKASIHSNFNEEGINMYSHH